MPSVGRPNRPYLLSPDEPGGLLDDVWPPLLFGAERLDEIKRKIERCAWAAAMLTELRGEADAVIARERPLQPIEPIGWRHDFWSPVTGDPLVFEPDRPFEHWNPGRGTYETGTPAQHRAWVLLAHERTHRRMRGLALLYRLTGDEQYASWVADGLRGAAALFAREDLRQGNPHHALYYQPLYDAPALAQLAIAYDLIRRSRALTAEDHQSIVPGIFGRGMPYQLAYLDRARVHNMTCWVACAVATCGNVLARTDWLEAGLDGEGGLAAQLIRGVDDDGFWFEGTTFYHWYSFLPLASLFELSRALGDPVAEDPEVVDRLASMLRAPAAMADDQDRLPVLGDLGDPWQMSLTGYRHAYEYGAGRLAPREFGPIAARLAKRAGGRDGWTALAFGLGDLPDEARRASRSVVLPSSGVGVFRSRSPRMWALFRCGPHSSGHDHRDKLQLAVHAFGHALAPDPGTAGYGLAGPLEYYRSTLAHNTLMVDEQDQGEVKSAELIWEPPHAEGILRDAYRGVVLHRQVTFDAPCLRVEDTCYGDQPHRYAWVFGACGPVSVQIDGVAEPSDLPPWPRDELAGADRRLVCGVIDVRWRCADRACLRLLVTSDGPVELATAELPGNPLREPRRTVVLRAVGSVRRFRALLEAHRGQPSPLELPPFDLRVPQPVAVTEPHR